MDKGIGSYKSGDWGYMRYYWGFYARHFHLVSASCPIIYLVRYKCGQLTDWLPTNSYAAFEKRGEDFQKITSLGNDTVPTTISHVWSVPLLL